MERRYALNEPVWSGECRLSNGLEDTKDSSTANLHGRERKLFYNMIQNVYQKKSSSDKERTIEVELMTPKAWNIGRAAAPIYSPHRSTSP